MLVFSAQNLVLLSVPKTGSTALEVALKPWADIAFYKQRKHTPLGRYRRTIRPFLRDAFDLDPDTMAVIRAPLDHLRSWYRYRAADLDVDFDGFVEAVLSDAPPPWARIGSQLRFLGNARPTHLFAYERQPVLRGFLCDRMGAQIAFPPKNVSPEAPTPISAQMQARFEARYAEEIALHAHVLDAGGHLMADRQDTPAAGAAART